MDLKMDVGMVIIGFKIFEEVIESGVVLIELIIL